MLDIDNPSQFAFVITSFCFVCVISSMITALICCGGKKEPQPNAVDDAKGGESKGARGNAEGGENVETGGGGGDGGEKSKKSLKQGEKSGKSTKDATKVTKEEKKVDEMAYQTMAAENQGNLKASIGGKANTTPAKAKVEEYGTMNAAKQDALKASQAPKATGKTEKVGVQEYGTMQAAKENALTASKRAGGGAPKAKEGDYGTMMGVGDKMTASKAAAANP